MSMMLLAAASQPSVAVPRFIRSQVDTGAGTTYTFTGAELPAGLIAVVVIVPGNSGITIDSVAIGGQAATVRQSLSNSDNEFETWDAVVSGGNSGTVSIVTSSATAKRCAIGVWSVVGLSYITGTIYFNAGSTTAVMDVATTAGDFVICYVKNVQGEACTATGYTQAFDETIEGNHRHEGGQNPSATGGSPEAFSGAVSTSGELLGMSAVYR